jgi:CRP-like cAMP-binding protein
VLWWYDLSIRVLSKFRFGSHIYRSAVVQDPELARDLGWEKPGDVAKSTTPLYLSRTLRPAERIHQYERQISRINKFQLRHGSGDAEDAEAINRRQHRASIYRHAVDMEMDADHIVEYPKSEVQKQFLLAALRENFIFMEITDLECQTFVGSLQQDKVASGTVIIRQGDVGDFFYIVESGSVDFVLEESGKSSIVGTAGPGDSFGELALIHDSPRAVSCVATSAVVLWKIDQRTFRYLLAHQSHQHQTKMCDLLRRVSMFKELDSSTLRRFVASLTPVHWKEGARIVQKGEEGSVFYIVESGNVKVHDIGLGDSKVNDLVLGPGEWFGERALLTGEPRAANVTALTEVATMAMDRETFEKCLGPLQNLLDREMRKQSLKSIPIFGAENLTEQEIEQLADLMVEVCYRKGEHLAEIGQPYQMTLWIIRHGRVIVYSSKHDKLFNLQVGDYFGDKSIRTADPNHISSHTATCEENLTAWVLTREQIESVLGDIERLGHAQDFSKTKREQHIHFRDLTLHRVLGEGAFGQVWLTSHDTLDDFNVTRTAYALKAISKRKVIDAHLVNAVKREKELLSIIVHPLVLSLVASYQDESNLYLLLPLIPGGDLYDRLHKMSVDKQGMKNDVAAFYAACIIEGIGGGFHNAVTRIAYRDLKLENVMVDGDGYGKIVDLGFAKIINGLSYTLCGTPEMLAPELIMSKGHDHSVDYWAFGVVVYELLVGHSPFYVPGISQLDLFKRIVLVKYSIPPFVRASAKHMIQELLVRKPGNRLGNMANGYLDIKLHPWFSESGISFKQVFKKTAEAPWKPPARDPLETKGDGAWHSSSIGRHEPSLTREDHELFRDF